MGESGIRSDSGTDRLRLLIWKCRRGMKELDILLENFVRLHREALSKGQWPEFEALLSLEDDQLWDCIRDPEHSEHQNFEALVRVITQRSNSD